MRLRKCNSQNLNPGHNPDTPQACEGTCHRVSAWADARMTAWKAPAVLGLWWAWRGGKESSKSFASQLRAMLWGGQVQYSPGASAGN